MSMTSLRKFRYKGHREEDKKPLIDLLRRLKGIEGNAFNEIIGNALVEFKGYSQEKDDKEDPIERLLFYDFILKKKSRVNDPSFIGDNGFVQRRVDYRHPGLGAKVRVCTFYIGKMSFRQGRSVFGLINIRSNYKVEGEILRIEDILGNIKERSEIKERTPDQKFRYVGGALERAIRENVVAVGYREEEVNEKKVIKFKSLYVSPSFVANLI